MDTFLLPPFFDYGATFLWAVSGALLAARAGYDVVGIMILAMVSATGGGLLRDGLFLQDGPPVVVQSPVYLAIVVIATLFVLAFGKHVQRLKAFEVLVSLVDALGLGAYAVVGMNRASALGLSILGIGLVGLVNAVGGGVLRAVLMARESHLMRPGTLEAIPALAGCVVFLLLTRSIELNQTYAAWITIAIVFVLRAVAVRYGIRTRALPAFEHEWRNTSAGSG